MNTMTNHDNDDIDDDDDDDNDDFRSPPNHKAFEWKPCQFALLINFQGFLIMDPMADV